MNVAEHIVDTIVKPLNHICNKSFETGTFPNEMKITKIVPLFNWWSDRIIELKASFNIAARIYTGSNISDTLTFIFADDTNVLNKELFKLSNWFKVNKL